MFTRACAVYEKYNAVMRACSGVANFMRRRDELCHDNRYASTIHAINSCILKVSKVTRVSVVYRGFAGRVLPPSFWAEDADGVAGGCEYGFLSATTDRSMAAYYAANTADGVAPTVLEMRQAMVDRGADLAWLSQYEHEREVAFPPLTGLEMISSRVDGHLLVLHLQLSLNLTALTLEQVNSTSPRERHPQHPPQLSLAIDLT